jgi:hypothetical protein
VQQQKCLAHLLGSIRDVVATKPGWARDGGERRKGLLQDAIQLPVFSAHTLPAHARETERKSFPGAGLPGGEGGRSAH